MTLKTLDWSAPATTGYATIRAEVDGDTWIITPVPRDVVRIGFSGKDADGTIVDSRHDFAYAESVDEAKLFIDLMRVGADDLPEWRVQLEAAGFTRHYPDAPADDVLSGMWRDERESGSFTIMVLDGFDRGDGPETSVRSSFQTENSAWHNNVTGLADVEGGRKTYGPVTIRTGAPEGVDVLRTGVAAALAVRAARQARGGRFSSPIGGAPAKR